MNKLKELIENNRTISYRKLAKAIGISCPTLYSIMFDKHKPSPLIVKAICKYFDVNYKDYI